METPSFETRRLILRSVEIEDAPSLQKHFADYEIIRNLHKGVPWPYPENGAVDFITRSILPKQGKDHWIWGIFLKTNPDELIGVIDLWRKPNPDNRGFWLGRAFWGQGIMTEAVTPVMNFAFHQAGFDSLIFANAQGNKGSRRVKEKTGARLIRVEPAEFVDPQLTQREVWQLDRQDWLEFVNKRN